MLQEIGIVHIVRMITDEEGGASVATTNMRGQEEATMELWTIEGVMTDIPTGLEIENMTHQGIQLVIIIIIGQRRIIMSMNTIAGDLDRGKTSLSMTRTMGMMEVETEKELIEKEKGRGEKETTIDNRIDRRSGKDISYKYTMRVTSDVQHAHSYMLIVPGPVFLIEVPFYADVKHLSSFIKCLNLPQFINLVQLIGLITYMARPR